MDNDGKVIRVSEWILNCTSAKLGYIALFPLVQAAKHSKNKTTSGLVAFYDTRPGNKIGLFYNNPQPTQGKGNSNKDEMTGVKQNECERGGGMRKPR